MNRVPVSRDSVVSLKIDHTVTDAAAGKVVLDANHPLAGMALRLVCEVLAVRAAEPEEIRQGVSLPGQS